MNLLTDGEPWWRAGAAVESGGNGAAMRAAPAGLRWAFAPTPAPLLRDAVLAALPTHTHPVAVAGSIAVAAGVAWCIRQRLQGKPFSVEACLSFTCAALDGVERDPTPVRNPGGGAVLLRERLAELPRLLSEPDPMKVFAYTYNGAFALESVPAAFYCFLRSPDDPRQTILTAVNAGFDADTVASMAGNLSGA